MTDETSAVMVKRPCRVCGVDFVLRPWQMVKRDYRCLACRRVQTRIANATVDFSEKQRAQFARADTKAQQAAYHKQKRASDPSYVLKRRARRLVAYAIEKGTMRRLPCERCGATKVDAHHADYNKPFEVVWLCRRCHYATEKNYELADRMLEARKR